MATIKGRARRRRHCSLIQPAVRKAKYLRQFSRTAENKKRTGVTNKKLWARQVSTTR